MWGLLPIYFGLLHHVGAVEVVAQRVCWSLLLILFVLAARRSLPALSAVLRSRRLMTALACSAALIGINWLTYVWAVQAGHVVGASLGYFLNPLVNVLLGVLVLKERMRRGQVIAIVIAAVGVALMAAAALDTLWVSIVLALSFAFYGLVRKLTPVDAFSGLGAETIVLAPAAFGWCLWLASQGKLAFGQEAGTSALLILAGAVTTVPLVLFAVAARRVPLAQLGLLQYMAPTMQFLCGVLLFGERLSQGQMVSFALIWCGLLLFAWDSVSAARRSRVAVA
jgi:chloramphenicol-sensitive protein RarD